MKPTYTNLAKFYHLTRQTIATYKKKNPEMFEALRSHFIKRLKEEN